MDSVSVSLNNFQFFWLCAINAGLAYWIVKEIRKGKK